MAKVKRLYKDTKPLNYNIHLDIDEANETFNGDMTISFVKTSRPSSRVTLHARHLSRFHATLEDHKGNPIKIRKIGLHKTLQEVRFYTEDNIKSGHYVLKVKWHGKIHDNMEGLYVSQAEGQKIFSTQFEATSARICFPCVDEPEAKATFDCSLTTTKRKVILSNQPAIKTVAKDERVTTTFDTTPIMSTYLLAFCVGDFVKISNKNKHGVEVNIFATPENKHNMDFGLDVAVKALDFFEDYYGIKFPLKKCDLVAVPDFSAGAMENWGLITFREQCLLVDPKHTSLSNKEFVALVICHELAHQWFGNLVTMQWWTDLWLNEGFASYMEHLALDHIFPEWQTWKDFINDNNLPALSMDSLRSTHPVEVPINHPDEIRTVFDSISYNKGAAVIHMLRKFVGDKAFQKGVSDYLKKYSYKNAITKDLWQSIDDASHKDVVDFMKNWTAQSGHPVLKIESDGHDHTITQKRFYILPKKSEERWPIPLLSSHHHVPLVLKNEKVKIKLREIPVLNEDASGFYRVEYSEVAFKELINQAFHNKNFTTLNYLLNNFFDSCKLGHIDTIHALHFLEQFEHLDDYFCLDSIAGFLSNVRHSFLDVESTDTHVVTRLIFNPIITKLGVEATKKDTEIDTKLRTLAFGQLLRVEDPFITGYAQDQFAKANDAGDIDPNFKPSILAFVARDGNAKDYLKLEGMLANAKNNEERNSIGAALMQSKVESNIKKQFDKFKDSSLIRLQDLHYWISSGLANRYFTLDTFKWIKHEWAWLTEKFSSDLHHTSTPLMLARNLNNQDGLDVYREFFDPLKKDPYFTRSVAQGEEAIQWRINWKNSNK